MPTQNQIAGCILGTALGDSIGLPYEGLSRQRAAKLFGSPDRQRFFFGRGMVSDDTEHTCMVAQALIDSHGDANAFARSLAWRLRWWFLALPAGAGLATIRACIKLWLGFSPQKSGVFSAGNGPAMRSAILGVVIKDLHALHQFVQFSTRITHTDPKAEYGALAVAIAARMACQSEPISGPLFLSELKTVLDGRAEELFTLMQKVVDSVQHGESTENFAASLGFSRGVSGYIYHTVPVALHAWLSHPQDFRTAVIAVIRCGGDTDSTAAIVGGIVGASVGKEGLPQGWQETLLEWPRSISWIEHLAAQLHANKDSALAIRLPIIGLLLRNLFFLAVVLFHGFRRLLPPY